eukprot:CAMPEP_0194580570 /NCGR_PEP_ID=MMETSP0292-20121207/14292_1 /TAXON_ID=39354 /ORGANISM="Heterosigma akashiwo, Strain CCMP2393" /LENGTH=226 /DNA_ID=CAMNT_0039433965 /DNA_START=154 /DNA_END=831 /DNA_ORIENTATION=+
MAQRRRMNGINVPISGLPPDNLTTSLSTAKRISCRTRLEKFQSVEKKNKQVLSSIMSKKLTKLNSDSQSSHPPKNNHSSSGLKRLGIEGATNNGGPEISSASFAQLKKRNRKLDKIKQEYLEQLEQSSVSQLAKSTKTNLGGGHRKGRSGHLQSSQQQHSHNLDLKPNQAQQRLYQSSQIKLPKITNDVSSLRSQNVSTALSMVSRKELSQISGTRPTDLKNEVEW